MICWLFFCVFFFKQKTAYEMRISDWSSDVCSSDLAHLLKRRVDVGEIFEFGRTDEREIGGVEEENRPLALHVSIGDVDEFAILERGGLDGFEGRIENGPEQLLCCGNTSHCMI